MYDRFRCQLLDRSPDGGGITNVELMQLGLRAQPFSASS
jgi:hypothetical protein